MVQEKSNGGSEATNASQGVGVSEGRYPADNDEGIEADEDFWESFTNGEERRSTSPEVDSQSDSETSLIPSGRRLPQEPESSTPQGLRPTGMDQLDMWIGGGLVEGSIVLVEGDPDSIADQFLYNIVPPRNPLIYYSEIIPSGHVNQQLDTLKMIPSDGREILDMPRGVDCFREQFSSHDDVFDNFPQAPTIVLDSVTAIEQEYEHDEIVDILTAFHESISGDMVGIIHRDQVETNRKGWLTKKMADTIIEVTNQPGSSCSVRLSKLHPNQTTHDEVRELNIARDSDSEIEIREQNSVTATR